MLKHTTGDLYFFLHHIVRETHSHGPGEQPAEICFLKADCISDRFQAYIFMKMILDIIHCFDAMDGIYMAAPQVAHTGGVIYDTLTVQAAKTGLCVRLIKLPYIIIAESIAFYLFHAFFDTET